MEETEIKKKLKWQFFIPVIIAVIIGGAFIYVDYIKKEKPENIEPNNEQTDIYKPKPLPPSENPRRAEALTEEQLAKYGCGGPDSFRVETIKDPDHIWLINKMGETTTVSLGKYKINAPKNTIFDIQKLWLYFFSEKLGREKDNIYALENSYVSRMLLVVNDYKKEIKLGGDEYMLIELDNYPFGDIYPYDQAAVWEFEFLIDLKCKNISKGECLDNNGESLEYINGGDIRSQIRFFALGCQYFAKDITIEASFKYGD